MESYLQKTTRLLFAALILMVGLMAAAGPAAAHRVTIFAWVEGQMVHTQSKFSGGKKVKQGRVAVFAPDGVRLLDGRTDDQGAFAFRIPQETSLRVELTAGAGHKGHWLIPLEEIRGNPSGTAAGSAAKAPGSRPADTQRMSPHDDERLAAAIEEALDRKLKPVMKLLAESQQAGPSLTEIIGGIGYIIGLVGIAAYYKSRQKD